MENSKNKTRLLYFIIPLFVITFIFLTGCSTSSTNSVLNNISNNMSSLQKTIENVEDIENSALIIEDFMDEANINIASKKVVSNNTLLGEYFTKISNLNNSIVDAIYVNNSVQLAQSNIMAKSQNVKDLCKQIKHDKIEFDNSKVSTLSELNSSMSAYITRIKLTKNEVKNNFNNTLSIKENYSSKAEQLASRYKKLEGSLNTRLSNYTNIIDGLDQIIFILNPSYSTYETTPKSNNEVIDKNEKEVSLNIKKNIDTYENAGRKYKEINNDNNNNVYNNPYYNNYGMYGGYGYGYPIPFGFGYHFPNINTYRGFKNIDTYKKFKDNFKEEYQTEDNDEYVRGELQSSTNNDDDETFVGIKHKRPRIEKLDNY